ncbi:MAG TPA: hypothetical protein VFK06_09880 [Candidatus Angelobacter sp.]|nr:hypothetical protein [Candidatus Angelobacter sp.]
MKQLLRIRESSLECSDDSGTTRWSLQIEDIVLMAEYTTNEGPWGDDYLFVFVTVEENKLYFATCSFYADGRDDALARLQERLGSPIALVLTDSTEWNSRVLWPPEMARREYFTFTQVPAETLRDKAKQWLSGPAHEYVISRTVRDYLQQQLTTNM